MKPPSISTLAITAALALAAAPSGALAQQASRSTELYHIFDIRTSADKNTMIRALTDGLNFNVSDSQTITPLVRGEPPETPGTFELVDPLAEGRLGALGSLLGSAQAAQLKQVRCDGAVWISTAQRRLRGSQNLRMTLCLFPYVGGYHLDVYAIDTADKGGSLGRRLGRAIAGAIVGDPGDWTNKTIVDALRSLRTNAGGTITYVEGQPAFSGEPWNESSTLVPSGDEKRRD